MPKPNVLFLHSHNTGRFTQPYGHAVPAPNLQRLAEEGVLFRRAFAAALTCSPSRASFLTGQYPHVSGMLGLAHRGWGLTDTKQHIAHTLRDSGYTTVLCGVEHTAPHGDNRADPVGYDRVLPVESAHADQVGLTVVDFLASKPEPPFFMSVGLHETHIPFPEPDPQSQPAEDPRYCQPPPPLPDTPKIMEMTAAFKASVRAMDGCWGAILEALDRAGLADDTLLCCFSDHGLQFPLNMCNLTDHGIGVYLIIRGPEEFRRGVAVEAMVSLIDLFPTVCEVTEIDHPTLLHGKPLLPYDSRKG